MDPDALARYRHDVLESMRNLSRQVKALQQQAKQVFAGPGAELEKIARLGHDLAEYAYDNDGELLNPGAQEMIETIDNGIAPDIEDAREQIAQPLEDLLAKLARSLEHVAEIEIPPNAMARTA